MLNIRDINKAMEGNWFDVFCVDKGEMAGDNLQLIISMYECEGGTIIGKLRTWEIICENVRESNIKFASGFTYLRILKDHPILYKYNKPQYMISGPIQLEGDNEIYGRVFNALQEFLGTYNARDRIIDFMPYGGSTAERVHFTFGPREIADIYRTVLGSRGLKVTAEPEPRRIKASGREQILLFTDFTYVIAEKFHITQIDIT